MSRLSDDAAHREDPVLRTRPWWINPDRRKEEHAHMITEPSELPDSRLNGYVTNDERINASNHFARSARCSYNIKQDANAALQPMRTI
jgi:hypothetical protein